ncbi:hypothetical protein EBZ02_00620 [bacterium]|nr:hypothetical protein [bacterium]
MDGLKKLEPPGTKLQGNRLVGDPAPRMLPQLFRKIAGNPDFFHMKGVGDEHPAAVAVALAERGHELLVVAEGAGDGHPLHVAGGEGVDPRFVLVDGLAQSPGDEVGQAHPEGVALGFRSQPQGRDNVDFGSGQILEAVDPVLEGFVRARCEMLHEKDYSRIMPILIHGDAALAGQGVVSEVAQMSQLKGYHTGGSLHFVINNQIGFTTDFDDARSSDYCTAIANAIGVPVVHVNGDDAEAVTFAVEFAVSFRQQFKRDVFVDMVCYRRHGHNESDEPKFTQPTLYSAIDKHPDPRQIYSAELERRGDINGQLAADMEENFKALLQDRLNLVKQKSVPYKPHSLDKQWEQMRRSTYEDFNSSPPTSISEDAIRTLVDRLTTVPEGFQVIRKVQRVLDERRQLYDARQVNWAKRRW